MNPTRSEWLTRPAQPGLAKKLRLAAWLVTAVVFILVGLMRRPEFHITLPEGVSLAFLPAVNAVLNTLVTACLVVAIISAKRGNILLHRRFIHIALLLSTAFLLCYTAYHFTSVETRYGGDGAAKAIYLFFLATHIILAGLSLPFILFTYILGFTNQFAKHRRMARPVAFVWLYVAITGPICYLMLRPYY